MGHPDPMTLATSSLMAASLAVPLSNRCSSASCQNTNMILQGPPGTGKTWLAKKLAYALIGQRDEDKVWQVQFHPNLSYEDFVRGWRPQGDGELGLVDGPFLELSEVARQDPNGTYVMVIEEINGGNPASIFGELLTLLEADKRTPDDALTLAYQHTTNERFHIPSNLYVIGTMNLADRSLALVDLALRRRFAFFDLEPAINETDRRQLPNWSHDKPDDICHPREAGRRSSRSLAGGSQAYRYATTLRF